MKADRQKMELAMARACMSTGQISQTARMPHQTVKNVLYGRNVKAYTLGKVAKALNVDVTEIMETEG